MQELKDFIINIPDFPKKGIIFRDVTGVLEKPQGLKLAIHTMQKMLENVEFDAIVGAEARGFIFGMPLAYNKSKAFIPVRKKGKLPRETVSKKYDLEYGSAEIEIHKDSIKPGMRVVFVDDLLATGGTARAAAELLEEMGAKVIKMIFLIELDDLGGGKLLENYNIEVALHYDGE